MAFMAASPRQKVNDDIGGYGCLRKRPSRTQSTPYDRPSSKVRTTRTGGWLSWLVNPAKQLIASGFSFLSKQSNLVPPLPPAETNHSDKQEVIDEVVVPKPTTFYVGSNLAVKSPSEPSTEVVVPKATPFAPLPQPTAQYCSSFAAATRAAAARSRGRSAIYRMARSPYSRVHSTTTFQGTLNWSDTFVWRSPVLQASMSNDISLTKRAQKRGISVIDVDTTYRRRIRQKCNMLAFPVQKHALSPGSSYSPARSVGRTATARSLGKVAIYTMVRSPNPKVRSTTSSFQGTLNIRSDTFGRRSPLSQTSMSNDISLTKRAQKRGSSVIDNDIGPVSTIRRVRQKSKLLPVSATVQGSGLGSSSTSYSSSTEKSLLVGKSSIHNGDNGQPGSVLGHVPLKSRETASRILREIDALVTIREKSPSQWSPSMLNEKAQRSMENIVPSKFLENVQDTGLVAKHDAVSPSEPENILKTQEKASENGLPKSRITVNEKARSSMENVESSKFLENVQDNGLVSKRDAILPGAPENILGKQEKVSENGPTKSGALFDKAASDCSGVDKNSLTPTIASSVKSTDSPPFTAVAQPIPFKKHGFRMIAPEIDDDNHPKDKAPVSFDEKKKQDTSVANNTTNSGGISRPASSLINSSSSAFQHKQVGTAVASTAAEKAGCNVVSMPSSTITPTVADSRLSETSNKISSLKDTNSGASITGLLEKGLSHKEPNDALRGFSAKTAEKVPAFSFPSSPQVQASLLGTNVDARSGQNPENLKR